MKEYCDVCSRYGTEYCGICFTVKGNGEPNMFLDAVGTVIRAGDMVRNTRTGERLIVAGVNYELNQFVPMGYPFPSIEKICEYEVVERDAVTVTEHIRNSLRNHHMESYIEPEARNE